jgi:hypothetical protein
MTVAGTQMSMICGKPMPSGSYSAIMAAMAADTGEAVIACWEAMVATAIGRSGRMPFS